MFYHIEMSDLWFQPAVPFHSVSETQIFSETVEKTYDITVFINITVCMYACMYVGMHVGMHVCIYLPEEKQKKVLVLGIGTHFDLEFWPSQIREVKAKLTICC